MTQSIIQSEHFPKDFFYVCYNCSINWLKHIINVTFIDNYFCVWAWIKSAILFSSFLPILLNTKTNVVMKLKPFNWVNNSIGLLLISASLNCSSQLKEFKISTL